jgi:hypothetical protein
VTTSTKNFPNLSIIDPRSGWVDCSVLTPLLPLWGRPLQCCRRDGRSSLRQPRLLAEGPHRLGKHERVDQSVGVLIALAKGLRL